MLQKDIICLREITEPRGYKPHYKGSDNSHTVISHGERQIEFYKDMNESSNKYKIDSKYS